MALRQTKVRLGGQPENARDRREKFLPALYGGQYLCVLQTKKRKAKCAYSSLITSILQSVAAGPKRMIISGKVEFFEYVPHEDLPKIYRETELFVQTSFYEGD